jgi:hypothetical protein
MYTALILDPWIKGELLLVELEENDGWESHFTSPS